MILKYSESVHNHIVTFDYLNYFTFILVQFKTGEEIWSSWRQVLGFAVVLMHSRFEVLRNIVETPVVYSEVSVAQSTIRMPWSMLSFRQPSRKSGISLPLIKIFRCWFAFLAWLCCAHGESKNDTQRNRIVSKPPINMPIISLNKHKNTCIHTGVNCWHHTVIPLLYLLLISYACNRSVIQRIL